MFCFLFLFLFFICSLPLLLLLLDMLHCSLFGIVVVWLVRCFTPCIIIAYCGASPLPYGVANVCCGASSFVLSCCLLWCIAFTLQCALLLLFIVFHHPSPCVVVIYCGSLSFTLHCCLCRVLSFALCFTGCDGALPSHCVVTICYGASSLALCYCLLWFIALTLCCKILLWSVIPYFVSSLLIVVHYPCLALLLFNVVCRSSLYVVALSFHAFS